VHFIPLHLHRFYRQTYGYRPEDFPTVARLFEQIVSLPIYPKMAERNVQRVIEAVCRIVAKYRY